MIDVSFLEDQEIESIQFGIHLMHIYTAEYSLGIGSALRVGNNEKWVVLSNKSDDFWREAYWTLPLLSGIGSVIVKAFIEEENFEVHFSTGTKFTVDIRRQGYENVVISGNSGFIQIL